MSDADADTEPGAARRAIRTVTPLSRGRPNPEMGAIGWTVFLGLLFLLLPLLPFLAIGWVVARGIEYGRQS